MPFEEKNGLLRITKVQKNLSGNSFCSCRRAATVDAYMTNPQESKTIASSNEE